MKAKRWDSNMDEKTLAARRQRAREWNEAHKDQRLQNQRLYFAKNKSAIAEKIKSKPQTKKFKQAGKRRSREFRKLHPWYNSFQAAKQRCTNPKHPAYRWYGAKDVVFDLSQADMVFMWHRDNAVAMRAPSLDRINNDGPYNLKNCHFLEMADNSRKRALDRWKKINGYSVSELVRSNSPTAPPGNA